MKEQKTRIILPKNLQMKMLEFFMKTSIPRKKETKNKSSNSK